MDKNQKIILYIEYEWYEAKRPSIRYHKNTATIFSCNQFELV